MTRQVNKTTAGGLRWALHATEDPPSRALQRLVRQALGGQSPGRHPKPLERDRRRLNPARRGYPEAYPRRKVELQVRQAACPDLYSPAPYRDQIVVAGE